jgi:hypothetical protein
MSEKREVCIADLKAMRLSLHRKPKRKFQQLLRHILHNHGMNEIDLLSLRGLTK